MKSSEKIRQEAIRDRIAEDTTPSSNRVIWLIIAVCVAIWIIGIYLITKS